VTEFQDQPFRAHIFNIGIIKPIQHKMTTFLSLTTLLLSITAVSSTMINLQTGIDLGSTFAGGMTFDKEHNRLFLTGGTYARGLFLPEANYFHMKEQINSDCFLVAVELDSSDPVFTRPTRLGYVKDAEACSTAHFMDNHNRVFLGGSATGHSMGRTDIDGDVLPQSEDVALLGEVISVSLDHVHGTAPVIPQHYVFGGHGFYDSAVNYPFAVASDDEGDFLYVASLYSKYTGQMSEDTTSSDDELDMTHPYTEGNVWGIAMQKLTVRQSNATDEATLLENPVHLERQWQNEIETKNYEKLYAADMVFVNGMLLVAGSTVDVSEQFAGDERKYHTVQDMDGFLIKIDPETGRVPAVDDSRFGTKHKMRIQSNAGADEIVTSICLPHTDDIDRHVYVTGYTTGLLDSTGDYSGGFIMKIDADTMEVVWLDQIHGENIEAIDCAVTDDGEWVYVTGNAKEGGALRNWESRGGYDIWVRKYNTFTGQAAWEIQLGSDQNESLAKGGAVVVDNEQNAVIYGNTRGNIGRERAQGLKIDDNTNDIFVMTITSEGAYLAPESDFYLQIPTFYAESEKQTHWVSISLAIVAAVVLLSVVLGIHCDWRPVSSFFPEEEGEALNDDDDDSGLSSLSFSIDTIEKGGRESSETESVSSDGEEEDIREVPNPWNCTEDDYTPPQPPYWSRQRRDLEEEKTEIQESSNHARAYRF
jgi:hypothetical protein